MLQYAIFVDAGYFHAAGSAAVSGSKQNRTLIQIDVPKVLFCLKEISRDVVADARLLRCYWYDGLPRSGRRSSEQEQLAQACDCKLRLGVVNSHGVQKGVDSLIVTDIIELARNRAVTDVVVVAGDEDVRIGVQIAQTFGVKVHLIGISPSRSNQSPDLIEEADSHREIKSEQLATFMTIGAIVDALNPVDGPTAISPGDLDFVSATTKAIDETIDSADEAQLDSFLKAYKLTPWNIPQELDRPALARLSSFMGRRLEPEETKEFRRAMHGRLKEM